MAEPGRSASGGGRSAGSRDGRDEAAEICMVVGGDVQVVADDGVDRPRRPSWWRQRGHLLLVGALLCAAVAVVALARPARPPMAELLGTRFASGALPDAPTRAVVARWTAEVRTSDRIALTGERVVVAEDGSAVGGDGVHVTARHVRSGEPLWERELDTDVLVALVDGDGVVTTMPGDVAARAYETPRWVALAAEDGGVLWERTSTFLSPSPNGHVLVVASGRCELLDATSGSTAWSEPGRWCTWADDDEVLVHTTDGWELRGLEGDVMAGPVASDTVPAAVGDDLVLVDDADVVLVDRQGRQRWRTPIDLALARETLELVHLPGLGVVVGGYDEDAQDLVAQALDLQGGRVDLDAATLAQGAALGVGERTVVVAQRFDDEGETLAVVDADDPGTDLATLTDPGSTGRAEITRRGILWHSRGGDLLELLGWPDLAPVWSVDMTTFLDDGGHWSELHSSSHGLLVISRDRRTLHALS